jgi:uncharacterized membrane protein
MLSTPMSWLPWALLSAAFAALERLSGVNWLGVALIGTGALFVAVKS